MRIDLKSALSSLPLPATAAWPEGVWDKTVFAHGTMSVLVFAPRGRDYQTSHTQDELYIIMKGSGTLQIEDKPFPFVEGDVLFVPAGKHHRFVDFTRDLTTWAIFWVHPAANNRGLKNARQSLLLLLGNPRLQPRASHTSRNARFRSAEGRRAVRRTERLNCRCVSHPGC